MSEEAIAVGFRYGRLALVLGNELGITAAEIVAAGDQTRLDLDDLPGTRSRVGKINDASVYEEALLTFASETNPPGDDLDGEVEVFAMEGAAVPNVVGRLNTWERKAIIAEAVLVAWRQRLSDAADSLDPLTNADAELVGRLNITGKPLITELRAARRRPTSTRATVVTLTDDLKTDVDDLVADLRAAVRFGAAGLADATDDLLPDSIGLACEAGGWVDRLGLLIAAEEVCAWELLALCNVEMLRGGSTSSSPGGFDPLLARYAVERDAAKELSALLDEIVPRLPCSPKNPVTRLLRRRNADGVRKLIQTTDAYSSVTRTLSPPLSPSGTWAAATHSLVAIERAADGPDSQPEGQSTRSFDEAAELLGDLFAARLPAARALVDAAKRQHPGVQAEGLIQIIKRQAVKKLSADAPLAANQQRIPEVVAELAMAIAILREFALNTDAELQELGRRLLARADRISKLQAQAGNAIPVAANGFRVFAQQIQPLVAEYLFRQMGPMKPSQPGAARNAYKAARSKVWRTRHDRDIAHAAAGGAAEALRRAIDAGAPRMIVRYVDRSLRAPRGRG